MQAIQTRYLEPTDTRGSRIVAECEAGRVTLNWDDTLSADTNHVAAREILCRKLGWDIPGSKLASWGKWHQGQFGKNIYWVFVAD